MAEANPETLLRFLPPVLKCLKFDLCTDNALRLKLFFALKLTHDTSNMSHRSETEINVDEYITYSFSRLILDLISTLPKFNFTFPKRVSTNYSILHETYLQKLASRDNMPSIILLILQILLTELARMCLVWLAQYICRCYLSLYWPDPANFVTGDSPPRSPPPDGEREQFNTYGPFLISPDGDFLLDLPMLGSSISFDLVRQPDIPRPTFDEETINDDELRVTVKSQMCPRPQSIMTNMPRLQVR